MKLLKSLPISTAFVAIIVAVGGCINTPFAPIAVPRNTAIRKEKPVNHKAQRTELEKLQKVIPPSYKIVPQDTFAIVVVGYPNMSRPSVVVMPDGTITMAPIGTVKLAGLTLPEARQLLTAQFHRYIKECDVVLEPITLKPYTFTIGGMVNAPGIYPFSFGAVRLTDAVAMAQGLVSTGEGSEKVNLSDLNNAYIVRNGKVLPVDFTKALIEGDPLYNIPMLGGDYIYIPSSESGKITILGEVNRQACLPFQPNLTLLQVMGFVGGLKPTNSQVIKIIRGGLNHPVVYNVNIKEMQLGRAMDFVMKPKDIVFVPKDPISEWNAIISQILPTIQLLNAAAGPFGNPQAQIYDND